MIQDELIYQILQDFGFEPTHDQRNALQTFAQFMTDRRDNAVMILRGSAGTGKTSLAGAIVRTVTRLRIKVSLLAPRDSCKGFLAQCWTNRLYHTS